MVFQKLLKKLANILDESNIPYMVIGGQAVLLYGEPRLTRDIDITLGIGTDEFKRAMDCVSNISLKILVDTPEKFVKETMVLPAIDEKTGIRVDFIFSFSLYERSAIKRAKNVELGKTTVKFASLEDLIIHKIIAGRARDIEDIKTILLKNQDYDTKYIASWLKEFDISLGENFSGKFKKIVDEVIIK